MKPYFRPHLQQMKPQRRMKYLGVLLAVALAAAVAKGAGESSEGTMQMTPVEIEFPKDHRFHSNRNEWVYFSGTVTTAEGREFGVMFTVFQFPSGAGRYGYPAMLGISDLETSKSYSVRIPGQNGSAGATAEGLPSIVAGNSKFVWGSNDTLHIGSSTRTADGTGIAVDMKMTPTRDILYHGGNGFILMGDGIPSGYFSLTNLLPTGGTLTIGEQQYNVTGGRMWMDRQWGDWTGAGYIWDWFSLRFDDGGALMLFQFRDAMDRVVMGNWTYRDKEGRVRYGDDFKVVAKRKFKTYPIDWTVTLPSIEAKFEIKPVFDDQTFTGLWEGLCLVTGRIGTSRLSGEAFVELNGY